MGRIVEFTEHLHKFVTKAMNALRNRWENFWSSEPACLVRLVEPSDVLDKLVYAATNPVKDQLVEKVHHWPGVNGLSALLNRRPLTIQRPRHFFRTAGPMPPEVTLELVIPPELGDADEVRRVLRERVAFVEAELATARGKTGVRILGRKAISRQPWWGQPSSFAPRGGVRPRVAARGLWPRLEAYLRNRDFVSSYREARERWRAGLAAVFPIGTYWLRRFANVSIAAPAAN